MNIKDIENIIERVDKSSLSHFEYEAEGFKLVLKKEKEEYREKVFYKEPEKIVPQKVNEVKEGKSEIEECYLVKSPIVGTIYLTPSPDLPPFIKVGDKVNKGDTLCIIEAMKLMNEIESEVSGEIVEILTSNEAMVEYGEVIIKIKI